jgi:PPK2 family polyphosphate:nucleotide phosphotransferase
MIRSPYLVVPGRSLRLSRLNTADKGDFSDKTQALRATRKMQERLKDLQELLYAQSRHAVLIVLQAMDAGGKDGTIEHVFSGVNPQGCSVSNFKVPSDEELAHDYLWRIHKATPRRGMIGVFNRSHYESVLVERVKKLVPSKVWSKRYDHINQFERLLADEGTVILKLFLHISRKEQKERFEARLRDPHKRWKFNPQDLVERQRWGNYMAAYQDALERCSTPHAPWYVIPSDHKWFRNWAVSDILVRTLESLKMKYPPAPRGLKKLIVR